MRTETEKVGTTPIDEISRILEAGETPTIREFEEIDAALAGTKHEPFLTMYQRHPRSAIPGPRIKVEWTGWVLIWETV